MIKNLAIVTSGTVTNLIVVDDADTATIAHFGGLIVPAEVAIGWTYSVGVFAAPLPPVVIKTLEQVRSAQLKAIDSAYDVANQSPISYMATTFQADVESQSLIAAVLTASGGSLPNGFAWFDTNNSPVEITFAQLQGLAGSILLRGQPLFVTKQTKKALIRAATTIQQVESITW